MNLRDFVNNTEDGPTEKLLDGLEHGVFYQYVASSYLNGIVNYTTPIAGILLERYGVLDREKVRAVTERLDHPSLEMLGDDVILLCSAGGDYYVFWFDRDVSDCCVGRFKSDDAPEKLAADLGAWVESLCDRSKRGVERSDDEGYGWECLSDWMTLPLEYLRCGWINF